MAKKEHFQKIFSADDWGFSPGINEGILELARSNLLHSVSCAANVSHLHHGLPELLEHAKHGVEIHLHFNLTYGVPLTKAADLIDQNGHFHSFKRLLTKLATRKILAQSVAAEFESQLLALKEKNIPVTGIDGHQHIHLFPHIYKSIRPSFKKNGIKILRTMEDPEHFNSYLQSLYFKKFVFIDDGSLSLKNTGYLLSKNLKNANTMENKIRKFDRLLVHPSKYDDFISAGMTDPLQQERIIELEKILEYF